jgi:hypothetical protein
MRADPVLVEKDVPGLEESDFVDEHLRKNRLLFLTLYPTETIPFDQKII